MLAGLTSELRFYLLLVVTVASAIALVLTENWLAKITAGWWRLTMPGLALAWFGCVMSALRWVGRRVYEELELGYVTLTISFGGFYVGGGRRWSDVGRRAPWDYRGIWVLDSKGHVKSTPDRSVDPPGFYPSPSRPQQLELWSGRGWMREFKPRG